MSVYDYSHLLALTVPELLVVAAAFAALLVDLAAARQKPLRFRMRLGAGVTVVGSAAAICWIWLAGIPGKYDLGEGMLVFGPLTQFIQSVILVLTIFTAILSAESGFTEHAGEYYALLLIATTGMMFLVSSENLLMIFLCLELLSLALYILTAFNKRNASSAEAALKYFLFGAMSAAFLLFGLSLLYGLTGELTLSGIALRLAGLRADPLLLLSIIMVVAGFGFKIAVVPFHLWAPDTYQGAPIPSAAFIASGSKVASFFILGQFMVLGLAGAEGSVAWHDYAQGWMPIVAVVAGISILVGNLAAIVQSSVRRLLAYSAIAQAGYMLLGILAEGGKTPGHHGLAALVYYLATYGLTVVGAFGVVGIVQEKTGDERLGAFAGLSRNAPLLAICMLVFMLSLAGIPPLAGFFGKFYLFTAALNTTAGFGLLWLVILAIAMSAVSLYYYLQVLKQVFAAEPPAVTPAISAGPAIQLAIAVLAGAVLILGCAPDLLLEPFARILNLGGIASLP